MKNKSFNILVVVESVDVEGSSGAKANLALINNLKTAGFGIEVLHYTRKEIILSGISTTVIKEKRRSLFFMLSRLEAFLRTRLKLPLNREVEKLVGFSFTLLNDRNSIISCLRRKNPEEFDLVMTLSQGGSFRPHHALLKLPEWHSKWLAYIHDPYPMRHFPPPYTWTEPGSEKKEFFVRQVSEKAAFSAFPGELLLEWMGQFHPQFLKTGIVIPHQISDHDITNKKLPELFNPVNFNIVHAGNLLWGRDPGGLIEGFKGFLRHCPEAKQKSRLIFIGGKNHYSKFLMEVSQKHSEVCLIEENIPFDLVASIQNLSSVNVILEGKSELSPFLPGKFPHCVAANRPILLLGPPVSESRRLLGSEYPFWEEIDRPNKIALLIEQLYDKWKHQGVSKLDRQDLEYYLSYKNLKEVILSLKKNDQ
ncbi:UDP-glycosyltransferase [Salinimicrobium sp. TIG7-5_MAKvit]|uniref:UDP-glycosyltransferase n=1 Tax=Salinimicrobium sp. TIG7-5_MAKvit TaxID=3121289 RepID=UPI003C6E7301